MYKHKYLVNINKVYTYSGKYNYQNQYTDILESAMVSTPEIFTDNISMSPRPYVTFRNPSAWKSLRIFTEVWGVKKKTAVLRVGAVKSKRKSIRELSMLFSTITNRRGHIKINKQVKKYLYNWIIQHPQVLRSPIHNYCLKCSIDGHSEPQLV